MSEALSVTISTPKKIKQSQFLHEKSVNRRIKIMKDQGWQVLDQFPQETDSHLLETIKFVVSSEQKQIKTIQALLIGLVVEINGTSYRLSDDNQLWEKCREMNKNDSGQEMYLKTNISFGEAMSLFKEMTNAEYMAICADIRLKERKQCQTS